MKPLKEDNLLVPNVLRFHKIGTKCAEVGTKMC